MHRSPGVVFSQSKKVKDVRGRPYYLARIIPMRGSWLDFEFDSNDYLYVRIDKKKKILGNNILASTWVLLVIKLFLFSIILILLYAEEGEFYQKS